MTRPNFSEIYMNLAWMFAQRSTCERLKVGCVITSTDYEQVLSVGYNGNAKGLPNKCDSSEPGSCGCIHAEMNALIKCRTPSYVDKYVFVTHSPCKMCAKSMINLGKVVAVSYDIQYRSKEGIDILTDNGVYVYQIKIRKDEQ